MIDTIAFLHRIVIDARARHALLEDDPMCFLLQLVRVSRATLLCFLINLRYVFFSS